MGNKSFVRHTYRLAKQKMVLYMGKHLRPERWLTHVQTLERMLERRSLENFLRETDFAKLDVSNYPVRFINAGTYRYAFFAIYAYQNIVTNAIYCLSKRQLPRINILDGEGRNIWTQFFEQPYHTALVDVPKRGGALM